MPSKTYVGPLVVGMEGVKPVLAEPLLPGRVLLVENGAIVQRKIGDHTGHSDLATGTSEHTFDTTLNMPFSQGQLILWELVGYTIGNDATSVTVRLKRGGSTVLTFSHTLGVTNGYWLMRVHLRYEDATSFDVHASVIWRTTPVNPISANSAASGDVWSVSAQHGHADSTTSIHLMSMWLLPKMS